MKKGWITPAEVPRYCETGSISCDIERLIDLQLALEDSLFQFYELIKKFIIEDKQAPIMWNEDSNRQDFNVIPQQYWNFWEIEFLSRIIYSDNDKQKKLHQVALIHSDFNYPPSCNCFIYFMAPENNIPIGVDGLYDNLITYIEKKRKYLSTTTS